MTIKPDTIAYPPLGMSREEAARYVGVGVNLFDQMVRDRRMPRPKLINSRTVWDRVKIEMAFAQLGGDDGNSIDRLMSSRGRPAAQPDH